MPRLTECGVPAKLYYTAVARSTLRGFRDVMAQAGVEPPAEVEENPDFGTPDELITTTIDCSAVAGRKYASLAAHASQSDNIFFLQMGEELFSSIMGSESFVRAVDSTRSAGPRGRPLRRAALTTQARSRARAPTGRKGRRPGPEWSLRRGPGRGRAGASVGNRADEAESPAASVSTAAAATSTVNATLAKGASHESLKPKSPCATDDRGRTHSRRTATSPTPITRPAIDWSRTAARWWGWRGSRRPRPRGGSG